MGFAIDEDDDVGGADAKRGDLHALDGAVRVAFEQVAVLVDARLALLGVDQQELAGRNLVARGLPLGAHRKVGAAAAAHTGVFDQLPDRVAAQAERLFERLIRVWRAGERIYAADVAEQSRFARWLPGLAIGRVPR